MTRTAMKAANLPFVPKCLTTAWTDLAFGSLLREGYKGNSAVWACVRVHARAFPEPEMHVWRHTGTGQERIAIIGPGSSSHGPTP